jgi:hypothetical protein
MSGRPGFVGRRAALAVAIHPRLWRPAVTFVLRTAPRGWWRHWPPLPSISVAYAEFRVHTALGGSASTVLQPGEVTAFLEWCRRMQVLGKGRRHGG